LSTLDSLLAAVPGDPLAAFVLADYLEEQDDRQHRLQGELLRRVYLLTRTCQVHNRPRLEERLRGLIEQGVRPIGPYRQVDLGKGVGMTFAWVPPGTFLMGSPEDEEGVLPDEGPQREVTLTSGFWMAVHVVTQGQWESVRGSLPCRSRGTDRPVVCVSWEDGQELARQFGQRVGLSCRLPTEAEWEYACRAGTTTPFHFGPTISTDQVNFDGSYPYRGAAPGINREETTPVGSFPPNAFGLYDMHGNVWEWCADWYAGHYYRRGTKKDPKGPRGGTDRVLRGGTVYRASSCRSAYRNHGVPGSNHLWYGVRLVLDAQ
jgi:formylglycine-generating enzyme required for sulfatase activity